MFRFLTCFLFVVCADLAVAQQAAPLGIPDPVPFNPVTRGIKVCSPYVPNAWRAGLTVPQSWTGSDCQRYASTVGGQVIQLQCIFDYVPQGAAGPFTAGAPIGLTQPMTAEQIPNLDCGWAVVPGQ